MSLLELLAVMGLLAILSGFLGLFLTRIFRYGHRNLEQNTRTRRAQILYSHLLRDLHWTSSAGVTWQSQLGCLAIQPLETVSPGGQAIYSSHRLILYLFQAARKQVTRKEFTTLSLTGTEPARLDVGQLQNLIDREQAQREIYPEIEEFDLGSALQGTNLSSPLHPRVAFLADRIYGLPKQVKVKLEQELYLPSCP